MMKNKLICGVSMALVSALCIGATAYANPMPTYAVDAGGTATVMTVGGEPVYANEYAAYINSTKMNYEGQLAQFGMDTSTLWEDESMVDSVRQSARDMATQYHVIAQQFKKDKLSLNQLDLDAIKRSKAQTIEQLVAYGGENAFEIALQTQGMTEQMYDNSLVISAYVGALNEHYFGNNGVLVPEEDVLLQYYNDNYVQARHILVLTTDETGQPLAAEQVAEKRARAEEALTKAQAGEDFAGLMTEYSEDTSGSSSPNGFTFTTGEMEEAFYTAAAALSENAVSDIVETPYGFHIIQRMPLTDMSRFESDRQMLISGAAGKDFYALLEEWVAATELQPNEEELAKVTLDNARDIALSGVTRIEPDAQQSAS